jgi:hypothetical protein
MKRFRKAVLGEGIPHTTCVNRFNRWRKAASEETNTKSDVALTEIQILARNSLRFAPGGVCGFQQVLTAHDDLRRLRERRWWGDSLITL